MTYRVESTEEVELRLAAIWEAAADRRQITEASYQTSDGCNATGRRRATCCRKECTRLRMVHCGCCSQWRVVRNCGNQDDRVRITTRSPGNGAAAIGRYNGRLGQSSDR